MKNMTKRKGGGWVKLRKQERKNGDKGMKEW